MAMTKQAFIALADRVKYYNDHFADAENPPFTQNQIFELAAFCGSQNDRFMADRWLDYIAGKCGRNGGKVAAYPAHGEPARRLLANMPPRRCNRD